MSSATNPQDGSVLVLALWTLFFLAALTVASASYVVAVLNGAERIVNRARARMEVRSGIARTVAIVQQESTQSNVWSGVQESAWNRSTAFFPSDRETAARDGVAFVGYEWIDENGVVTNYGVIGEAARLNLNTDNHPARTMALVELFATVGDGENRQVAESLFVPVDFADQSGVSTNRFESVEALIFEENVGTTLYNQVKPYVTVYGDGLVNVNSAPKPVLVAMGIAIAEATMGRDSSKALALAEGLADDLIRVREQGVVFESREAIPSNPALGYGATEPKYQLLRMMAGGVGFLGVDATAYRGVVCSGNESGLCIEFIWDVEESRYRMWREFTESN